MKLLILLLPCLSITYAAPKQETVLPAFVNGGRMTELTDITYTQDEPGYKHKKPTGEHVPEFSMVYLTPYIDLISGIPVARKEAYQRIIPYRKRMQASTGMLRSAIARGKKDDEYFMGKRDMPSTPQRKFWKRGFGEEGAVPDNARRKFWKRGVREDGAVPNTSRRKFWKRDVREEGAVPNNARRKFWKRGFGDDGAVPSTAYRKFWKRGFEEDGAVPSTAYRKRGLGFTSLPESELLGLLGSQFSNMMYGKREKTFPGNRLPISPFFITDKRAGIPRRGSPIRTFEYFGP